MQTTEDQFNSVDTSMVSRVLVSKSRDTMSISSILNSFLPFLFYPFLKEKKMM